MDRKELTAKEQLPISLEDIREKDHGELIVVRPPEVVLEEARQAAQALTDVLGKKKKKVMFNGEQYLEFEDWQTLGRFYGVTAKVIETRYIKREEHRGYEARAVAIRADGLEISAAEAECLSDEEKWRARPKYKTVYVLKDGTETEEEPPKDMIVWEQTKAGKWFPKKKKILVGEEPVPLFQLKSMAQTRACAKALRNVLAWVVVLAGYRPTPAEEMDDIAHIEERDIEEVMPPKETPRKPQETQRLDEEAPSTQAQHRAIFYLLGKLGITDELSQHEKVSRMIGMDDEVISSMKVLTKDQASQIIDALNKEVKP